MAIVDVLHPWWQPFSSDFCPNAPESCGFAVSLLVYEPQRSAHVGRDVRMVEFGLQLLYVGGFHCLQLFLGNGVLYGDGHEAMVVVVPGPPSDCQLCVHNFVLLDLLVLAIAAGLPVLQVVLAAADVPEFGELPVQGETHIHNAVRIVVCKSVCFGRNAQSVEQLTCCLHLGDSGGCAGERS